MAESNRHIMERYTREFLPTGDAALAEEFVSPDIKIIEERAQLDMLGILRQIGAAEVATEKGTEES